MVYFPVACRRLSPGAESHTNVIIIVARQIWRFKSRWSLMRDMTMKDFSDSPYHSIITLLTDRPLCAVRSNQTVLAVKELCRDNIRPGPQVDFVFACGCVCDLPIFLFYPPRRREVNTMTVVVLRQNESQDQLLKRFRKKVVKSGILSTVRRKRWFVSKSEQRRMEEKKAIRRIKRRAYKGAE
jgi:small subunit ribosomal protein S21